MKTPRPSQWLGLTLIQPHSAPKRAAAWLGLTLATAVLLSRTALFAEVLDDFSDPDKSGQIWTGSVLFGTGDQLVTNGQARITVTPFGDHGFSMLDSIPTFTFREGRTLEFRADLLSSSGDGAVARLGFTLVDGGGGYIFQVDQDTVSLSKRPNPVQLFLLRNDLPVNVTNVKLAVSMTCVQSNVLLQLKILDNDQAGRVVYATSFWDTQGRDAMQVGTDDPPGNYVGLNGRFRLGLYHDNAGTLDPIVEIPHLGEAEVVFDNAEVLEYESAWMAPPSTAVCMSWPENTAEEQIVVGANSLASNAVWTPWPEPIFKRFGELCMAVPTTSAQQFFKLVPGTQFIDDFSDPQEPFAGRNPWVLGFYAPADATRWAVTSSNGVLRVQALVPPADPTGRLVIKSPGPYLQVKDFWVAVDILNFDTTRQDAGIGLGARGGGDLDHWPGANNGYIAGLSRNSGGVNKAALTFWNGSASTRGPSFDFKPGTPYRFIFSGVGTRLSVELIDLELQQRAVAPLVVTDSRFSQGFVGFFMEVGAAICDITFDNFYVTGTKP